MSERIEEEEEEVVVEVEEDCLRASSSVSSCFILACKNFGVGKTVKISLQRVRL